MTDPNCACQKGALTRHNPAKEAWERQQGYNSQDCPAPGIPSAQTGPFTPTAQMARDVTVRETINCGYYAPDLTIGDIERIKEKQATGSVEVVALRTTGALSNDYEFDIATPGLSNVICLVALTATGIDIGGLPVNLTTSIKAVTVKPVYARHKWGATVLVFGKQETASGIRLRVTETRCECVQLCACQTMWHVVRVRITVPGNAPAATSIIIGYDFSRAWNDDACKTCHECGIKEFSGQDEYLAPGVAP